MHSRSMNIRWLAIAAALFLFSMPLLSHAQTPSSDLRSTIRAQLMSDPRTATLSQAQLDAMVELLAKGAQTKGITAQDLQWQPQTFASAPKPQTAVAPCTNFTCVMDEAFGFVGPNTIIPFTLGVASMGLIWILAEMLHRRRHPALYAGT